MTTTRLAIVAQGGMIWTVYDTWRKISETKNPRLFKLEEIWHARQEVERARAYAKDDDDFDYDPATVSVARVTLSFEFPPAEELQK